MAEIVEDPVAYPLLDALATCLCQKMADAGFDDMCFCGVMPGEQVLATYINEDSSTMAWVRLSGVAPLDVGPESAAGACWSGMSYTIEVGHAACAPIPEGRDLITDAEQLNAARTQTAMMRAARMAIDCCDWAGTDRVQIQSWVPIGPEGGILGGAWSVSAEVY